MIVGWEKIPGFRNFYDISVLGAIANRNSSKVPDNKTLKTKHEKTLMTLFL